MEDLTGKQLGPYRVIEQLGKGGMATVFKTYQPSMDRYVALKVLPRHLAEDPQFVQRFHQEARVLAQLLHPHILPVFDFGEADGYTYLVMPQVVGGTLAEQLQGRPLPLLQARAIISQVGDALDYAHSRGVIHRDVKPSNVLMDARHNCLLSDFGIAKIIEGTQHLTQSGAAIGTPAYMAPEQGLGQKVDHRSDIYALGVILYQLVTGRVPFEAETPLAVMLKHINDPLPPPRTVNPVLPEAVERVILKALAKQPEDRYATAAAFVQALQQAIPETGAALIEAPIAAVASPEPVSVSRPVASPMTPLLPQRTRTPLWQFIVAGLAIGAIVVSLMVLGTSIIVRNNAALPVNVVASKRLTQSPATAAIVSLPTTLPKPTFTMIPATATTVPTPILAPLVFQPLALGHIANAALTNDYARPPVGRRTLGNIPFEIGTKAFKTQAQPAPNNSYPTQAALEVGLPLVEQVHVLITAGDAFTRWQGQTVGRITLVFDGAPPVEVPLILGTNLREWQTSRNVVSSAPEATEVWQGVTAKASEINGVLDLVTIDVPDDRRAAKLMRVEFEDLSETAVRSRDPALTIAAVTVAHRSSSSTPQATLVDTPIPSATPACPAVTGPFANLWESLRDSLGCATTTAISGLVVEQNFVGGQMLWREPIDQGQLVILYRSGSARAMKHAPFVEGSPEFACTDANTPAVCPPTPKRGFGLVWCDTSEVRRQLGEALDCERSYTGSLQLFEHGFMLRSDSGTIYVVYEDGRWERK